MPALRVRCPPGYALAELAVALVIASAVVAAAYRALAVAWNGFADLSLVLVTRQNVRAAAQVLVAELRGIAPGAGDLLVATDTAVVFRAPRALSALCAPPNVAASTVVVRDGLTAGVRAIDPARDQVLLYRDGEPLRPDDDRWILAELRGAAPAPCTDGAAGTALSLAGAGSAPGELGGVSGGAPLVAVETVAYRLYRDASGAWWMGARGYSAGAWSATSPVAGPLVPRTGLSLRYLDAAGGSVGGGSAAAVEITIRGLAPGPRRGGPAAWRPFQDSTTVLVAPRNR